MHNTKSNLYGVYLYLVFMVCVVATLVGVTIIPKLNTRRKWVTKCAQFVFKLGLIPVHKSGYEKIIDKQCIVVANHASYIDAIILHAFLPPHFSFVIKSEMKKVPIAHFLFRRVGSKFVERFVTSESARDARNLMRDADSGESLAFFPEGTFTNEPGLKKFRTGAFVIAKKSNLPLVPVVINGSRKILPAGAFIPRYNKLDVHILDPIQPDNPISSSTRDLLSAVRFKMLEILDEPDMA